MVYDFIVVGSGPAGAVIASRLARSPKAPKVLLLEAGGKNTEAGGRVLGNRYSTFLEYPHYNWGYTSAPQKHLNGQSIDYSRGRGLGGSSAINFACFTVGPSGDFDHWAELVGDDAFNWQNARMRYDEIEAFDSSVDAKYRKYMNTTGASHGQSGPLDVCWPKELKSIATDILDAAEPNGIRLCPDMNSGDPIGLGITPLTGKDVTRCTAATACLQDPPENLTILTDTLATRVVFEGSRAVGVVAGGSEYKAAKEVIVSAGAIDSPKLLLLSGIGPEAELATHGIQCIKNLPGVGKNLQDHWDIGMRVPLRSSPNDLSTPLAQPNQGIPAGPNIMGWLRPSDALKHSSEFEALPPSVQRHIAHPTVPVWEHIIPMDSTSPDAAAAGGADVISTFIVGLIPQSRGSITLASSNPADAPISDPNIFSHPFDRRNCIEATRAAWSFMSKVWPSITSHLSADTETVSGMPKSMSEEDIIAFAKETAATAWHMGCTVKMGKEDDEMACVDTRFKVRGLEGLRVADMSIAPFVPNCHTQSVAYQIGAIAAKKLIEEYALA